MRHIGMSIAQIVHELSRMDLLPGIVFRSARAQCDGDVERAETNRRLHLPNSEQQKIKDTILEVIQKYELEDALIRSHPHYHSLILTGIGAHHAGQLLTWRLLLEELMSRGVLRMLVATGTVAAGVDFPARTVVVTADSRRGMDGYAQISSSEFQQMSGRAGRRGRDAVGFCLAAPGPFCDARTILQISKRPPEPLISAYFPSPSTVLNLLRYRNVDDLRYTVGRSFAAFMDKRAAAKSREEAIALLEDLPKAVAEFFGVEPEQGAPEELDFDAIYNEHPELTKDQRKIIKKIRRFYKKAQELEVRQSVLLENTLAGLSKLGYLTGLSLSTKGYWAANLCTSIVLELAELIESDLLANSSMERIAAIVASISADSHRPYLKGKDNLVKKEDVEKLGEIIKRVSELEMPGVTDERSVVPDAAYTVLQWLKTDTWQSFRSILILSGVAEGDAARLITQTAEHLNQISRLEDSHKELAEKAQDIRRKLMRPPLTEVMSTL